MAAPYDASGAPAARRRYISAVYEDKYFPEKNATIPFKWETAPGTPRSDELAPVQYQSKAAALNCISDVHSDNSTSHHNFYYDKKVLDCTDFNCKSSSYNDSNEDYDQLYGSLLSQPLTPVIPIYPLRPPPKLNILQLPTANCHFKVRDLLHHHSQQALHQELHNRNRHGFFSARAFLFRYLRSLKASSGLPVNNKKEGNINKQRCASNKHRHGLVAVHPEQLVDSCLQKRSHSFSHVHAITAGNHGPAIGACKKISSNASADIKIDETGSQPTFAAPERRCYSFNLQSAAPNRCNSFTFRPQLAAKLHDGYDNPADGDEKSSSIAAAAAAVWVGACILAAAADHHQYLPDTCKVAMKLRDLLQQSANFSTLEVLPKLISLQDGGNNNNNINESLAGVQQAAKRKSMTEAELRDEGAPKRPSSCDIPLYDDEDSTHGELQDVEDEIEEHSTLANSYNIEKAMMMMQNNIDSRESALHKNAKRKSFFQSLKTECIACWCPSSATSN